jgi:hypothetical protein
MDIVLGVSMTPTAVRMVLVEGDKADGATVDHDVFDITAIEGSATSSASEQVIAAILGTQESAVAMGHRLVSAGVTWSDHAEAAVLREALAARGISDVTLFSEWHAAGALAQTAGRVVGHSKTALVFVERDTATVSVVDTTDGSIVKVDSRSLHSMDAMAVLTEMVTSLQEDAAPPEGIFLLGSGVDVSSVKEHLSNHVTIPVSAPEHPEMALARGAALASANAPGSEASTTGLAYSLDPDGPTALVTQLVGSDGSSIDDAVAGLDAWDGEAAGKPFLLTGSALTAIFLVGVVALVISLAVGIRPTVDTRPNPGQGIASPSNAALPPSALPNAPAVQQPAAPLPAAPPPAAQPPAPETIPEPAPVVQQQPAPRAPVAQALAPTPREVAAAPAAPPEAALPPTPDAPPPAPAPVAPPPAQFGAPGAPAPAFVPGPAQPMVPILPPFIYLGPAPSYRQPAREYDPRWYPPPQQQWPQQPPQQQWPQQPPQQQWPQQQSPSDSGYGPGNWGPGSGRGGSDGPRGRAPLWPWPGD